MTRETAPSGERPDVPVFPGGKVHEPARPFDAEQMAREIDWHQVSRSVAKAVDRCLYRGCEDEVTDAYETALRNAYVKALQRQHDAHEAEVRGLKSRVRIAVGTAVTEALDAALKETDDGSP